jgi:hypothetical protein
LLYPVVINIKAMKTLSKIVIVLALLGFSFIMKPQQATAQGAGVTFQLFYDDLSPYGQWVEYPGYNYVWIPDAGPDFSPYATNGHWVFTLYGWTWVSDYPWGWAPFHYGRWFFDDYYGWMWVPGRTWGPAWVQWRWCEGFYGWAPLYPGVRVDAYFERNYHVRWDHWRFVRDRDFDRDDMDHYYIDHRENHRYVENSTVINNTYIDNSRHITYISGPKRTEVQKYTGKNVRELPIQENSNPGQAVRDDKLIIYKPVVEKTKPNGPAPVPQKAIPIKQAKSWADRETNYKKQEGQPVDSKTGKQQVIPQHEAKPPVHQDQGKTVQPGTPGNNNTGKPVPKQQKEAYPQGDQHKSTPPQQNKQAEPQHESTPPQHNKQAEPQHQSTPPHKDAGKVQPAPQHNGKPAPAPPTPKKEEPGKTENPKK